MKCPDCEKLEARVGLLELAVRGLSAAQSAGAGPAAGSVASDRELDDPGYGDPLVKKDPPRWVGQSFANRHYSACSPEFLDELASFKDWCAGKEEESEEKKKYARYSRLDARRARGWAARLRAGWKPPPPPAGGIGSGRGIGENPGNDWGGDDEIPF